MTLRSWPLFWLVSSIVNSDQRTYIKGRFISQNAKLIQDICKHTEKFNILSILRCLDFLNAFDHLEWNFMKEPLRIFAFGERFL